MTARSRLALISLLLAACTPDAEQTRAADPKMGRDIAMRWCFACHVVDPGATPLPDQAAAPPFAGIVAQPGKDHAYLMRFMGELHPPMPTYRLFPQEREDLVAYFDSLRPKR